MKKLLLILLCLPFIGFGQIEAVTEYSIITVSNGKPVSEKDDNYYYINISGSYSYGTWTGRVNILKNSTDYSTAKTRWRFNIYSRHSTNEGNMIYWCKEENQYYSFTVDNNSAQQKIIEEKQVKKNGQYKLLKRTTHYIK